MNESHIAALRHLARYARTDEKVALEAAITALSTPAAVEAVPVLWVMSQSLFDDRVAGINAVRASHQDIKGYDVPLYTAPPTQGAVEAVPVAWQGYDNNDPDLVPYWTEWSARKDDLTLWTKVGLQIRYAYPPTQGAGVDDRFVQVPRDWLIAWRLSINLYSRHTKKDINALLAGQPKGEG